MVQLRGTEVLLGFMDVTGYYLVAVWRPSHIFVFSVISYGNPPSGCRRVLCSLSIHLGSPVGYWRKLFMYDKSK